MKREEVECCEELFVHDQKVREVLKEMPAEETLKELADFYKVFGRCYESKDFICAFTGGDVCL